MAQVALKPQDVLVAVRLRRVRGGDRAPPPRVQLGQLQLGQPPPGWAASAVRVLARRPDRERARRERVLGLGERGLPLRLRSLLEPARDGPAFPVRLQELYLLAVAARQAGRLRSLGGRPYKLGLTPPRPRLPCGGPSTGPPAPS